ncbi:MULTISPECIES: transcriptional regulator [unclassified Streptomyces]|uniref:ArsR/SmtB family transcription factor n=1 Tax=unclassified Streptomyces TaxID=2593676 RepID=UPI002740B49B|nr:MULTISPECIES: helix-turn-helix domain-containing protein [unclassified Streptomyces]
MAEQQDRRITDVGTLKALAHPLRMKLYRALYLERAATASRLAGILDEAVSLVSYHLRKLAEHGLIEEAEGQSEDGRERWWRPASEGVTIHDEDFRDAPEKAAAHTAASRLFYQQRSELYHRHLDERAHWSPEWNSASFDSEYLAQLTAPELAGLCGEMHALIKKYEAKGRAAAAAGDTEGREHVALHVYGFPFRV